MLNYCLHWKKYKCNLFVPSVNSNVWNTMNIFKILTWKYNDQVKLCREKSYMSPCNSQVKEPDLNIEHWNSYPGSGQVHFLTCALIFFFVKIRVTLVNIMVHSGEYWLHTNKAHNFQEDKSLGIMWGGLGLV